MQKPWSLTSHFKIAMIGILVGSTLLAASQSAQASPSWENMMLAGDSMVYGDYLESSSGYYFAEFGRPDFAVYSPYLRDFPGWHAGTDDPDATATLTTDGRFVITSSSGETLFSSGTGPASNTKLILQNDGNLVLYSRGSLPLWSTMGGKTGFAEDTLPSGAILKSGQALWSHNGTYQAILQTDGNFVVYGPTGALWHTMTNGSGAIGLELRTDGEFVLYNSRGLAFWSSDTGPASDAALVMQDDGNLVLYSHGCPLWSSRFGKSGC